MAVARCTSSGMIPLWLGSRCEMRMKASPLSGGIWLINCVKASSPPADAPIATMIKGFLSLPEAGSVFFVLPVPAGVVFKAAIFFRGCFFSGRHVQPSFYCVSASSGTPLETE